MAVRFLACRRDGLVRRTIHRRPPGPDGGAAQQVADLGDVLVFLHGAVLVHDCLLGTGRQQPDRLLIGDHPPAGEQHGATPAGQREQVGDQLVAGSAPSTRTSSRDRMREGICRSAAVSTAAWSAKVSESALPGRSSIARLSAAATSPPRHARCTMSGTRPTAARARTRSVRDEMSFAAAARSVSSGESRVIAG